MSDYLVTLHWLYVAIMFGSGITFQLMNLSPRGIPHYKYLIHTIVVTWSGLAYAALALGQGTAAINGTTVYYARYIDWVITTPLLLLSLNLTAKLTLKVEGTLTAAMLSTQAIMIITGLVADLSPESIRWFWYGAGVIALCIILFIFWGPLRRKAHMQHKDISKVYDRSAFFLTVQWLLYPLFWAIGSTGLHILDSDSSLIAFVTLPVISKVGFSFFNLLSLRRISPAIIAEGKKV